MVWRLASLGSLAACCLAAGCARFRAPAEDSAPLANEARAIQSQLDAAGAAQTASPKMSASGVTSASHQSAADQIVRLPTVGAEAGPTLLADQLAEQPPTAKGAAGPLSEHHWRNRPFSGSYNVGALSGDPFRPSGHEVPHGFVLAKKYGWDFADHWGLETRIAEGWLYDSRRFDPALRQTERLFFWDLDLLYYPLGDTRIRPYVSLGAGLTEFSYVNTLDQHRSQVLADVPVGLGVKYPVKDWLALRVELLDNVAIGGGGAPTMNNLSLTGGAEIRFGNLRKHFMPWLRRSGD